jgi:pyridoxal phosphate enzyme (YggS family)
LVAFKGSEMEERVLSVRKRIEAAARRAGRDPAEITLVAVSKTQPPEAVVAACHAGLHLFGENRVEEAGPKAEAVARLLAPAAAPTWHMVGHVQSRKAADVLPWAAMVHSVDSVKLAERLSRSCVEAGSQLAVLLEVNVSGETSKYGLAPEELPGAVEAIAPLPGLRLEGLMTMAPIAADPELVRPVFTRLRALKEDMAQRYPGLIGRHLSMGMTDDFEVAIEEGATMVRVGRAIFGER